jgi:hypothetical protein
MIEDFKFRFSDAKYDAISHPEDTDGLHAIHIFSREDAVKLQLDRNMFFTQKAIIVPNKLVGD